METKLETCARKKPSEELLLRYAAIIEGSDDAIIGKTPGGIITNWNPGAERMFGYKAEEAIGESILIIFPADRVDEEIEILQRIAKGERINHYDTVRKRKDGSLIDVSVSSSPIIDSSGRIIGVSKIVRDLTESNRIRNEMMRARESLRDAQDRYRAALDHLLEGYQIIGFDWRYVYVNDAAAAQGKMRKEELLGRTMTEIYPGIENTEMFSALRRCIEGRLPSKMENFFVFPDGSSGWYNLIMEPVPEGAFILSVDITQEKKDAQELAKHREHLEELVRERTAELAEANKELEAFSYSVSHDLRAPLRHIDGFARLLSNRVNSLLDGESKRYLQTIVSSSRQMGTLIDGLLEFSKTGRTEIAKSRVAVRVLVDRAIVDLGKETEGRIIDWEIGPLPEVEADYQMLYLAILNLLSNAVKYTGGRERAMIEVNHKREGKEDIFRISDNGVGFEMKYGDKLFGVFQRLHSFEEFEGTGIGLANVRRIISRHGGRTWAEGKVDEGATFYFSLPLAIEGSGQ